MVVDITMTGKDNKKLWSQAVTDKLQKLDVEHGVFTWSNPKKIAKSLQRSALQSTFRKGTPLQSAMSMLNFYINRAGSKLDHSQKKVLEQSKDELRSLFKSDKD